MTDIAQLLPLPAAFPWPGRSLVSRPCPTAAIMLVSCFPELYFNVDSGYLEGLVRGFKAGVLTQADYLNLVQCESLEGEPPPPPAVTGPPLEPSPSKAPPPPGRVLWPLQLPALVFKRLPDSR